MRRVLRVVAFGVLGVLLLCAAAGALAALSNRGLPPPAEPSGRLSPVDAARLEEALRLKRALGDRVWPGWGSAEIPVLLWNRYDSFLVGHPAPPAPWELVAGDPVGGSPYYHRRTDDPQNFAVLVGDVWVASIATKGETDRFVIGMFEDTLPTPLDRLVPYRLLIQPSEVQIAGLLHEAFHVHQAVSAYERLEAAEGAYRWGDAYWAADVGMRSAWREEIDALARALGAADDGERRDLTRQFLERRRERRTGAGLGADLVAYERHLEWLEGLAKYVELTILREAYEDADYRSALSRDVDPDFRAYRGWPQRWSREVGQMRRQATREGDSRFYYTGMAQATLLDDLLPDWKDRALEEGVWLEDLLSEAVE